jgi:hypothetical protein
MIKQSKSNKKSESTETVTKLTPEELQEFKDAYNAYQKAIYDLGALDLELSKIKKRVDDLTGDKIDLVNHIGVLDEQQITLANKLGDKYGLKQVDLETGELK